MTAALSTTVEPGQVPDPAATAELPVAACEGYIDFIAPRRTFGWAWCRAFADTPVEVEIRIDDRPVVIARADKFRPDLARAGAGSGHHGFDVGLPEAIGPDEKHRVTAYVITAPGKATVPLINRTLGPTAARPGAGMPAKSSDGEPAPGCSAQVRDVLSRVMMAQKSFESSLTALADEVRHLAASRVGVDGRTELALVKAIEQLHAVQETLSRQSAAAEILQTRLDRMIAMLADAGSPPHRQAGGDRALYWCVALLAMISLSSLGFGIYSLFH